MGLQCFGLVKEQQIDKDLDLRPKYDRVQRFVEIVRAPGTVSTYDGCLIIAIERREEVMLRPSANSRAPMPETAGRTSAFTPDNAASITRIVRGSIVHNENRRTHRDRNVAW